MHFNFLPPFCVLFCFETGSLSLSSQADLELSVQPRLASDSQQSDVMVSHALGLQMCHRDRLVLTPLESCSVSFTSRKDVP